MTTPWPNARVAISAQSQSVGASLSPQEIAACCRAQFLSEIAFFFVSLGFLLVSITQWQSAVGIKFPIVSSAASFIMPAFSLWLLAQFAYLLLGGSENLEAVSQIYEQPKGWFISPGIIYFCVVATILVLFLAQPWLAKNLHLPKGSFWLVSIAIHAITLVVLPTRALEWWRRGRNVARSGELGSAQH
jgi:hypothetical protein